MIFVVYKKLVIWNCFLVQVIIRDLHEMSGQPKAEFLQQLLHKQYCILVFKNMKLGTVHNQIL